MQAQWLKRQGLKRQGLKRQDAARDVVVVFGGWAIGPAVLDHLEGDRDILYLDDFRDLDTALPDLGSYERRFLLAWSFGVTAYGHWQAGRADPFNRKVAVAGGLTPVDRRLGIPPAIFTRTIETLSEDSFQQFLAHCFGEPVTRQTIDVEARRAELLAVEARGAAPETDFDRIWLSRQDRIFPLANLERSWALQADRTRVLDAPHVPFARWRTWDEILA